MRILPRHLSYDESFHLALSAPNRHGGRRKKLCPRNRTIVADLKIHGLIRAASLIFLIGLSSHRLAAQQEKGDKEVAFQGTVTIPFENAASSSIGTLIPRVGYFLNSHSFVGLENDDFLAKGYQAAGLTLLYRYYLGRKGSRFQPYLGLAPGILSQRQDVDVQIVVTPASYNAAFSQIQNATNLTSVQKQSDEAFLKAEVQLYEAGCFVPNANASGCTIIPTGVRKVTTADFQGAAEIGAKFYVNRKFAFETTYRLNYVHQSTPYANNVYTVSNSTLTPTNYLVTFTGPTQQSGQSGGGTFKQQVNNFLLFGFAYVF